jgi:PAS domain S-box-containing protein
MLASETSRLAALLSYRVLDTHPEAQFDDIVQLARSICGTPVALVTLVAAERQWFKARAGVEDLSETPLSQSVCVHAIHEPELLVIPDLTLDPRTCANTLVTEGPRIRFYAGAVLRTPEGEALGALCVIDTVPRPQGLTDEQRFALLALARQTMTMLNYRRAIGANEAQQAGGVGTFEIDIESGILLPSPEFCRIFGMPQTYATDVRALETVTAVDPSSSTPQFRGAGNDAGEVEYRVRRANDGEVRWVARRGEYERDAQGSPTRLRGTVQDITERKSLEALQQTLNEELSHRMKNTLAMVDAIAAQTLRNASDQAGVVSLSRRIKALGQAHDVLLRQSMEGASIRATIEAVVGLVADLKRIAISGPDFDINARSALSFSLLIHELATNAIKYGSLSNAVGSVSVAWWTEPSAQGEGKDELVLQWKETGGPAVETPQRRGFGSRLIQSGLAGTGRSDIRYPTEGIQAVFRAPLAFMVG